MPESKYSKGLEGTRFNRTVVRVFAFRRPSGKMYSYYWICLCDCGTWHITNARSLFRGHCGSCGCLARDGTQKAGFVHGHAQRGKLSREFTSWQKMRGRVDDPKNEWFHLYGGRGIQYCQGFREFSHFLKVLGSRPENRTLDRINNNGHYSCGECSECIVSKWPINVRWATIDEQNGNKRNTIFLTVHGKRQPLFFWAKEIGVTRHFLYERYRKSAADAESYVAALTVPAIPDLPRPD